MMSTPINPKEFRRSLGQFATGVVIVTSKDVTGNPVGLTINSFSSVSMEPPLILFSLAKSSFNLKNFEQAKSYVINVLSHKQQSISDQFAKASVDKWQGVTYRDGEFGAPILDDAIAHFECTPYTQCDGGDHVIFIARVEKHQAVMEEQQPLIFFKGKYHLIQSVETVINA